MGRILSLGLLSVLFFAATAGASMFRPRPLWTWFSEVDVVVLAKSVDQPSETHPEQRELVLVVEEVLSKRSGNMARPGEELLVDRGPWKAGESNVPASKTSFPSYWSSNWFPAGGTYVAALERRETKDGLRWRTSITTKFVAHEIEGEWWLSANDWGYGGLLWPLQLPLYARDGKAFRCVKSYRAIPFKTWFRMRDLVHLLPKLRKLDYDHKKPRPCPPEAPPTEEASSKKSSAPEPGG